MSRHGIVPWINQLHPVNDGENVQATIANRQPNELDQRTEYLKQRMDDASTGEALYARQVAINPGTLLPNTQVLPGHAVYWNTTTNQYERAQAAVVFDNALGCYIPAQSCYVVGICVQTYSPSMGDILLSGLIRDFDFTAAIGTSGNTSTFAGAYYLSAIVPGMYSLQEPAIGVYVGYIRGDGNAHINPIPRNLLESHRHYVVDLSTEPAGVINNPITNEPYSFYATNPASIGWLPANHAVFNGLAPAGAAFGYNIKADQAVERLWPPIPLENAYFELNGIGVPESQITVDVNGIWWMTSCYGKAPWNVTYKPSSTYYESSCSSLSLLEQKGYVRFKDPTNHLRLHYTKLSNPVSNTVVTTLRPASGSPIVITNCEGSSATTGDLQVAVNLAGAIASGDRLAKGLKNIRGFNFTQGPIVTGLVSKGGIRLGFNSTDRDYAFSSSSAGGNTVYHGELTIDVDTTSVNNGQIDLVALNGVREQELSDVFYLAMPAGLDTSLRLRMEMPISGLVDATLVVHFWVMATVAGTLPNLTASFRVIKMPTVGTGGQLPLPTADTTIPLGLPLSTFGHLNVNEYVHATTSLQTSTGGVLVENGDTVLMTISRTGSTDGYLGDVGFIRMMYGIQ